MQPIAQPLPLPEPRSAARIGIVDDEPINVKVVRKHLQNVGYQQFVTTSDSETAFDLFSRENPDVIISDVVMPRVSGIDILRKIRADARLAHVPVLILTASTDAQTKLAALESGATDFLAKPVDPSDLVPRIRNALIVKAHHDHLERYSVQLEQQVRARTAELEISRLQVVLCLARAAEYRDDTTGRHVIRVGRYVTILASELGFPPAEARAIGLASQLHDVGKIGLPDGILLKPGKLTPDEFDVVKTHCVMGGKIVEPVDNRDLNFINGLSLGQETDSAQAQPLLAMAGRIALSHHERWDGKGYPNGLAGDHIPIEGRITSVADVFDALTSARPYKEALLPEKALSMMEAGRGTQFDPAILDAMIRRMDDMLQVLSEQSDAVARRAA